MKKSTLILWIVAAVIAVSSVPLFVQGNVGAGVCGLVIAAILFVVGLRKKNAAPAAATSAANSTPIAHDGGKPTAPAEGSCEYPGAPIFAPAHAEDKPTAPEESKYEFLQTKVAGVTFKNGRKSRQTILRKIYFKDEPFDKGDMELMIERGEWEGKPAFGVFVNGEQIGSIPAEHTQFVADNFSRLDGITNIEVYGGGEGRNYGAEIILRFRNE